MVFGWLIMIDGILIGESGTSMIGSQKV